jgi:hypothetical protein
LEPENDDTRQINSLQTFIWEESIDPNPDDVVGYQIWFQGLEDSVWFDAQSNSWEARVDTLQFYIDAYFRVTWWVKAISDPDTVESNNRFVFHLYPTSAGETYPEVPCVFAIQSVQPNPFNSTTTITYGLDKSAPTRLALYDLSGRQVRTLVEGNEPAGVHRTILSAANLPSGLYFVRLEASNQVFTQKVMLIR